MGLIRTVLRPAARLAAVRAGRQVGNFLAAHERTEQVQLGLLRELLDAGADSAFGRDHGLGKVRSYADFVSAVPVGDYETHRPYVQRVLAGEVEAMFAPGTFICMFAVTSGTTGRPKHIPVTPAFLEDYRRGWNVFGLSALRDHPGAWLRKIVTVSSSARESVTDAGVPCGAISGLLAENQMWIVRKMYPVPPAVRELREPAAKYYLTLRASLAEDVGVLTTANPSSAIKLGEAARDHAERLIRDVRDGTCTPPGGMPAGLAGRLQFRPRPAAARRLQALLDNRGEFLPKHFWNLRILTHWTGGTLGLYLPGVRRLYGDVPIRDIGLLASEGRLSVPLADHTPAGVAEITANFLEFIPAEQVASASPDVLRAHELEIGREYFIVLSNRAGLWRYNIDDRVRVTGRLGNTPVFEFLSRGLHTCSMTGEKLTEHQVVAAMAGAAGPGRAGAETFVLQGHFAETPYYELRVEPAEGMDVDSVARRMDEALRGLNVEYEVKRGSGRLGPIRAACAPPGSFAEAEARLIARRRGRSEQYKHKYLLTEVIDDGKPGPRREDANE